MKYIAHINENNQKQSVKEHCINTAEFCREYSVDKLQDICYYIGLLHDIGKYQPTFQKRINGESVKIEHSICGAIEANKANNIAGWLTALCIAGHHTGIPDCGDRTDTSECSTLQGRLKRATEDYSVYRSDLPAYSPDVNGLMDMLADPESKAEATERFAFITRYCFSCLVDADTIDTKTFCTGEVSQCLKSDFKACDSLLENRFLSFENTTELQKSRFGLQAQAFSNIKKNSEIYLMNMPTGSGKTLASLKCALYRAIKTNKKRIIYIIPYNSIIDQTASVFESIFGNNISLLRHQSSFSYNDSDYEEDYKKIAINASENWNADLIITTSVQFFESVYSNKREKLRKMHNMADSVLIFDEAHMMPIEYLQPCLRAVAYLTKYFGSEALFLTATMPNFKRLISEYALKTSDITELVPDKSQFEKFRKNTYRFLESISEEELILRAKGYSSALIVVNERKRAKSLYEKLAGNKYHLSTYMTGNDRQRVIREIKQSLAEIETKYKDTSNIPENEKITVVSTSLIEAGVDLDFECAFRELLGLDNILQTGGRCNREGKQVNGDVFIFKFSDNNRTLKIQQSITEGIIEEFDDISSPEAITKYYESLFEVKKEDIKKNSLGSMCSSPKLIPFSSYSVQLIKSDTETVIIPNDTKDCSEQLARLRATGGINMRIMQKYCATVYKNELERMIVQHAVKEYGNGIFVLENSDYYSVETGIQFEGKDIFL